LLSITSFSQHEHARQYSAEHTHDYCLRRLIIVIVLIEVVVIVVIIEVVIIFIVEIIVIIEFADVVTFVIHVIIDAVILYDRNFHIELNVFCLVIFLLDDFIILDISVLLTFEVFFLLEFFFIIDQHTCEIIHVPSTPMLCADADKLLLF